MATCCDPIFPDFSAGNIIGYYDLEADPTGLPSNLVTNGLMSIRVQPDIFAGFLIQIDNKTSVEYKVMEYPVKHTLFRKETTNASYGNFATFDYADKYDYLAYPFVDPRCALPICPINCQAFNGDVFTPECVDTSVEPPLHTFPNIVADENDCRIMSDEDCGIDVCASSRTYHEYEGLFYDFVRFYTSILNYPGAITRISDAGSNKGMDINVNIFNDMAGPVSRGTYVVDFTMFDVTDLEFAAVNITLYTHFRNVTYFLMPLLVERHEPAITCTVTPAGDLHKGDNVVVDVALIGAGNCNAVANKEVRVDAPSYEGKLVGVQWDNEGKYYYLETDGAGLASFSFTMEAAAAGVTLSFEGDVICGEVQTVCPIGAAVVESPITEIEFLTLIMIVFIILFSYRWFRKGRIDFADMLQDLKK